MGETGLELLPVVSRANIHKLEGIITLRDVLGSYGVGSQNKESQT
jgi:CBS domain-containing protein